MIKLKQVLINLIAFLISRLRRYLPLFLSHIYSKKLDVETMDDVLIIVPHPDDDTFGCGMLIKSLCDAGKHLDVVILSEGEAVLPETVMNRNDLVDARRKLAIAANCNLGLDTAQHLFVLDFPDNHFEDVSERSKQRLREIIIQKQPKYTFIPHPSEGQKDHIVATDVLTSILKDYGKTKMFYFCVWIYYLIPVSSILHLDFKHSFYHKGSISAKHKSMDIYMDAMTPDGRKISGNLPRLFLDAVGGTRELYFETAR